MTAISPAQDDVLAALRAFLLATMPGGFDAVVGVENRVAEPAAPDFAVMTPIRFLRLSTNLVGSQDVKFIGSIAPGAANITGSIAPAAVVPGVMPSGVLTVTATDATITVGADLAGVGVAATTFVTAQLSGSPGGVGTYAVNVAQTVLAESMALSWGVMTVSAVAHGTLLAGAAVFGVGVASPSEIRAAAAGGGPGTYVVSPTQTVASETLASGAILIEQASKITVQVDFHSATGAGADMAQTFSTAFRDEYATRFFAGVNANVTPFHGDDPRYAPFQNENQQYEYRWAVDAEMQVNQTVVLPQQYADAVKVARDPVDAFYAP